MGKKKPQTPYNDFLDGEKLHDNAEIRTSLPGAGASAPGPSPSPSLSSHNPGPKPAKPQLTHFLCLPLVTPHSRPQLASTLGALARALQPGSGSPHEGAVPPSAVRPVGTLHLTLGVMALDTEERVQEAGQWLRETDVRGLLAGLGARGEEKDGDREGERTAKADANAPPLEIDLCGLVPMHVASRTSVLYAEPRDPTARLYPFAQAVRDRFAAGGFLVADARPLKLHATIVNTIYARGKARGKAKGKGGSSWMRVDATGLVDGFADEVWARGVVVDRVAICRMGAREVRGPGGEVEDQRYEVVFEREV